MSWTEKLRSAKMVLYSGVKLNVPMSKDRAKFYPLGAISLDADLGQLLTDDEEAKAFQELLAVHDSYMAASCDSYNNYTRVGDLLPIQYILGAFELQVTGNNGIREKLTYPLVISPDIIVEEKLVTVPAKGSRAVPTNAAYVTTRGTRGLCYRGGLAVTADRERKNSAATLRHEFLHLMHQAMPILDEIMYGEGDSKTEEIMTHLATDQFDKLIKLNEVEIITSTSKMPTYSDDWEDFDDNGEPMNCHYEATLAIVNPVSVRYAGEAVRFETREIHPRDLSNADREAVVKCFFNTDGRSQFEQVFETVKKRRKQHGKQQIK